MAKPAKRSSIHPGVYPSGADRWQYKLRLPRTPDGKRPTETRGGFRTDQEAHEARVRRMAQVYDGIAVEPGRETVAEYIQEWLTLHALNIKPSTYHNYLTNLNSLIAPYLGDIPIRSLTSQQVERWIAILQTEHVNAKTGEKGLSTSSIAGARRVLVSALNHAVTVRRIIPTNPASVVPGPAVEHERPIVWTDEEIERVLPVLDRDEQYALIWRLGLFLQLRPGEILALKIEDVDLRKRHIVVQRTRARNREGRITLSPSTKSKYGARILPMTDAIVDLMTQQLAKLDAIRARHPLGPDWNPDGLVFPPNRAGRFVAHTLLCRRLERLCDEAGVRRIRPHGLRHTGATWLIRRGVPPAVVSRRLGHSSVTFTMDRYVHPNEDDQRDAGRALEHG